MRTHRLAAVAAITVIGAGSAISLSRPDAEAASASQTDAVVRELRAVTKELRKLNANVGTRFRDAPVITQLSDIKRSTQRTCEAVAASTATPC